MASLSDLGAHLRWAIERAPQVISYARALDKGAPRPSAPQAWDYARARNDEPGTPDGARAP